MQPLQKRYNHTMFEKTRDHSLNVKPLVGAIGDEVNGTDFGGDLSVETIFAIREALVEYGVIFSHDQDFEFTANKKSISVFC